MNNTTRQTSLICITLILLALLFLPGRALASDIQIILDGVPQHYDTAPMLIEGTTLLPMRPVFESLGATVDWDPATGQITAWRNGDTLVLTVGSTRAHLNGTTLTMTRPAQVTGGRTFVPLRFASEALGEPVRWEASLRQVHIGTPLVVHRRPTLTLGGRTWTPHVVEVNLNNPVIGLTTVLGQDRVGGTESLASMAGRKNALAAINGTFFSAYGAIQEPYGDLVVDGRTVHVGTTGTTFGFTRDNQVAFDPVRLRIQGSTAGSFQFPDNWYSYWINRTTGSTASSVTIFTPDRGTHTGLSHGTSVTVRNGMITAIGTGNAPIPRDGYVVHLNGSETYLLNRFEVGKPIAYRINPEPTRTDASFWQNVSGAIGAGPTLVVNGAVRTDPASEGFVDPKILTGGGARSAIGVTADRTLLLVTVPGATIDELARIMAGLGARDAMNLDGGASSGLYANGQILTTPGRLLSNALVVYRR